MLPKVQLASPIIVRCIWALMAAIHIPALISVWRSFFTSALPTDKLGGCIALTMAMVFFALKFWGVAFLRLRPGMRSWIAMTMVVALIHLDAIRPGGEYSYIAQTAVILASTSTAVVLPRLSRLLRKSCGPSLSPSRPGPSSLRSAGAVWLDHNRPHCAVLADRLFLLRAPPA